MEELTGIDGAIPDFTPPAMPSASGGLEPFAYGEVYDRIWCVPHYMRPQNPALDTDIPFTIWNAYPVPPMNTMNTITGSGQTGLTLDLSAPRDFDAMEELEVNLQIGTTAPIEISALYEFNFDYGQGIFIFETVIADWLRVPAETPIIETWDWLSDVLTAWDSTEQRIALRLQPRRRIEYNIILEDDAARQREYERWYNKLASTIAIPFYQYATRITQDSAISATKIYFDPDRTDVRDGELVIIYRLDTEESFLLRLDEVEADGATLASPLTEAIETLDIVAPAFMSRIDNLTGPAMTCVVGQLTIQANIVDVRPTFERPESTAVITEFDSLPVLNKRPDVSREALPEIFDVSPTIIDTKTGLHEQRTSWLHAFVSGLRRFIIPRMRLPIEMDW